MTIQTKTYLALNKTIAKAKKDIELAQVKQKKIRQAYKCTCGSCKELFRVGEAMRVIRYTLGSSGAYEDPNWFAWETANKEKQHFINFVCPHCNTLLKAEHPSYVFVKDDFAVVVHHYEGDGYQRRGDVRYPVKGERDLQFSKLEEAVAHFRKQHPQK